MFVICEMEVYHSNWLHHIQRVRERLAQSRHISADQWSEEILDAEEKIKGPAERIY
jgi:hypothetical protein